MVEHSTKNSISSQSLSSLPRAVQEVPPGDGLEVDQSSWGAFRSSDGEVTTGGLGPCCGIVVYNSDSKIAAVGHFACLSVERSLVDEMLEFVGTTTTEPKSLTVTIAGLAAMEEDIRPLVETERLRLSIVDRFIELGVPRESIQTAWADRETIISVDIHLHSGNVEIASYDISNDPDLFI